MAVFLTDSSAKIHTW